MTVERHLDWPAAPTGRLPPLDVDAFLGTPSNVKARTRRQAILASLAAVDAAAYLRAAGLDEDDLHAVRARLEPLSRYNPPDARL